MSIGGKGNTDLRRGGKFHETASFHRRLKNSKFFSKLPTPKPLHNGPKRRLIKDPFVVEIRNKHTRELVDIEVGFKITLYIMCKLKSCR